MITRTVRMAIKLAFQNQNGAGLYVNAPVAVMATSPKWSAL